MPKRLTPRGEAAPPVEPIVTGATLPPKTAPKRRPKPKSDDAGIKYVRNLHHIPSRTTLTTGREIQLAARGQREDLDIVSAQEQEDPRFLANKDLLFELIGAGEAREIIAKQQHNTRAQPSTLWDHLVNEKGKAYEQRAARIEAMDEERAIVVGRVTEPTADGSSRQVEMTRTAGPQITDAPGSPGHPATAFMHSVPGEVSPEEYHEFLLWKKFKAERAQSEASEA